MNNTAVKEVLDRYVVYRKAQRNTQSDIAKLIGFTQPYYCQVEKTTIEMTYDVIQKLHQNGYNVDEIITEVSYKTQKFTILNYVMRFDEEERASVSHTIIQLFLEYWEWNNESKWEQALYAELKTLVYMHLMDCPKESVLHYIRILNGISQEKYATMFSMGRTKCGNCEKGKISPSLSMLIALYNEQLCLPSLFFDDYPGLRQIDYLLSSNEDKRIDFFDKVQKMLSTLIKDESRNDTGSNL